MPEIDVTDLLFDTDIAGDTFTVVRRRETVNQYGESVLVEQRQDFVGAVIPAGASLQREGSFQVEPNSIKVVTEFRLRGAEGAAGRNYQPDLVLWKGSYFLVTRSNDYSSYGAGFIEADCEATAYVDIAAAPTPQGNVGILDFTDPANSSLGEHDDAD